ncbi:MAG: CRISPR-associated endonuclease Cas3'' [Thermodesulfobacteriota bacterium]
MIGPWAFENQLLVDHLLNVAEKAERFVNESYRYAIVKRLRTTLKDKTCIDEIRVLKLIKVVALFHDLGKAADQYQEQFIRGVKKVSFSYHEMPSAFIAYEFMKKVGYEEHEKALVTLSLINFHQAMRSYKEVERSRINKWTFRNWWDRMEPVFDAAEIRRDVWRAFDKKVDIWDIKSLIDKIVAYSSNISNRDWIKLYCLFMAPAVVGDMCDSLASRPKDEYVSLFREEVLKVCQNLENSG